MVLRSIQGFFLTLLLFQPLATGAWPQTGESAPKRIVVLGDSLAAGYGIGDHLAFPALLQEKIEERGWSHTVVNAGVSGDTSAGGLRRLDWVLKRPADVLILELGANDGLRGVALEETRRNLQAIIDGARSKNPEVEILLAGMKMPPNLGPDYTKGFEEIYRTLAEDNGLVLIPFLLEGVAGEPDLNQPDRIHPTAEGHRIVADTVWRFLEPLLTT